jgi:hypothetical protein
MKTVVALGCNNQIIQDKVSFKCSSISLKIHGIIIIFKFFIIYVLSQQIHVLTDAANYIIDKTQHKVEDKLQANSEGKAH